MKVHQNIVIDDVDYGDTASRKNSKFCNEGKWNNFIEPLLPEGRVFVEFGSNAGMFLKLAREKYQRVIGLERNKNDCKVAEQYLKGSCKIICRQIDENLKDIPLADVVLMANFHYHQNIDEFRRLLNVLETRACYVIVVSALVKVPHWRAQPDQDNVKSYFRHWELIKEIPLTTDPSDPHPREMFAMLFKSPKLQRLNADQINVRNLVKMEGFYLKQFAELATKGKGYEKSGHFKVQRTRRKLKWSEERLIEFIEGKYALIRNVATNGQYEPLILNKDFELVDGLHRYMALSANGENDMIVRIL